MNIEKCRRQHIAILDGIAPAYVDVVRRWNLPGRMTRADRQFPRAIEAGRVDGPQPSAHSNRGET